MTQTLRIPAQRQAQTAPAVAPGAQGGPGQVTPGPEVVEQSWGQVLRVGAARAVLSMVVSLLIWSLLPAVIGWTPRVILSGSMEPRIHVGDVIVTREVPTATLVKGQVLTVKDPDHPGITRTHRMVRRDAEGLIVTRGDANRQADSSHVSDDAVLGMGVIRVPYVGRPMYWVAERNWLALGSTLALLGLCLYVAFPAQAEAPGATTDSGGRFRHRPDRSWPSRRRSRHHRRRRGGCARRSCRGSLHASRSGTTPASLQRAVFYPYRTAVLADSPSFFWRLGEASGTAIDDAGTGSRDGTLNAQTATLGQAGALASENNTALALSAGRINANAAVAGPATFSVEAWFKSTSTTGGRILGMGDATGTAASTTVDRQLYLSPDGKVRFGIGTAKTTLASTAALNNGAWHHVVGTFGPGGNGMKLYVDGVLQDSTKATPVPMPTGYWRAGAEQMTGWAGNPDQYFDGTLDELAVYPTELSQARVTAHRNAGLTP